MQIQEAEKQYKEAMESAIVNNIKARRFLQVRKYLVAVWLQFDYMLWMI